MKKFSLYPNIYPINYHVIINGGQKETQSFFRKVTNDKTLEWEPLKTDARFTLINGHCLFEFRFKGHSQSQIAGLVAHEAVHASWYIEQEIGDLFNSDIQEPQCYLVQYLVQNILYMYKN